VEKLRLFVFKGVANELQKPAKDEESGGKHPERMIENGRDPKRQRHHNQGYPKAMAEPVDWMCMAACVLRDPLFAAASTKHGRIITQTWLPHSSCHWPPCCGPRPGKISAPTAA
jgi:hypothetical protein